VGVSCWCLPLTSSMLQMWAKASLKRATIKLSHVENLASMKWLPDSAFNDLSLAKPVCFCDYWVLQRQQQSWDRVITSCFDLHVSAWMTDNWWWRLLWSSKVSLPFKEWTCIFFLFVRTIKICSLLLELVKTIACGVSPRLPAMPLNRFLASCKSVT
jgi:hypothetical protein